jgi:hypothetical protein
MSARRLLETYLNDHLAAAVGAVELARRAARSNQDGAYGEFLAGLAAELQEDRAQLRSIIDRLRMRADPAKIAAAWTAEKLGRFKFNGRLLSYSPLSRLEELELLLLGVEGKLLLWESLKDDEQLSGVDFEPLIGRARAQRRRLRRQRLRASVQAFGEAR